MIAHHRQPASDLTAHRLAAVAPVPAPETGTPARIYKLSAVPAPGAGGEAGRAILTLQRHQAIVDYLRRRLNHAGDATRSSEQLDCDAQALAQHCGLAIDKVRRLLPEDARQTHNLMRPFVIRAVRGEQIELHVSNGLPGPLLLALLDDDFGIQQGASYQRPLDSGERGVILLTCKQTGIYPIYNQVCPQGSANRCLLGVLMIEP